MGVIFEKSMRAFRTDLRPDIEIPEMETLQQLSLALHNADHVLAVTGAGISVASGIATFRGDEPDAVWSNTVMEMGTRSFFLRHPARSWLWYLDRFSDLPHKEPNAAHHALAALGRQIRGRGAEWTLVTQNVDLLHEAAGESGLIKVHGTCDRVRCVTVGCVWGPPTGSLPMSGVDFSALRAHRRDQDVPRCPACAQLVRPHVLWFDEYYTEHRDYQFVRAQDAARRADVVVFVGTSFSVGITALILSSARSRPCVVFSIDPHRAPPIQGVYWIQRPAEQALPMVHFEKENQTEQ